MHSRKSSDTRTYAQIPRDAQDTLLTGSQDTFAVRLAGHGTDLPRLNEKQLAARWGVSVRTLQAARVKGSGVAFVRIGRSVRYRLEDVLVYEQARLRTNTSESD